MTQTISIKEFKNKRKTISISDFKKKNKKAPEPQAVTDADLLDLSAAVAGEFAKERGREVGAFTESAADAALRGSTFSASDAPAVYSTLLGTSERAEADRLEKQREEFPISSTAGAVTGSVFSALIGAKGINYLGNLLGIGKTATKVGSAIQGVKALEPAAKIGAKIAPTVGSLLEAGIYGGLETPESGFLDFDARGEAFLKTAPLGPVGRHGLKMIGGTLHKIANAGKKIQGMAPKAAKQFIGSTSKDLQRLNKFGRSQSVVDTLDRKFLFSDNKGGFYEAKLLGAKDSIEAVATKSRDLQVRTGKELDNVYKQVQAMQDKNASNAFEGIRQDLLDDFLKTRPPMDEKHLTKWFNRLLGDVNSKRITNTEAIQDLSPELTDIHDSLIRVVDKHTPLIKRKKLRAKFINEFITEPLTVIWEKNGKNARANVNDLHELLMSYDDKINYDRIKNIPESEKVLRHLRTNVRSNIDFMISILSEFGDKNLSKKMKELNKLYGNVSEIASISNKRMYDLEARKLGFGTGVTGLVLGAVSPPLQRATAKHAGSIGAAVDLGVSGFKPPAFIFDQALQTPGATSLALPMFKQSVQGQELLGDESREKMKKEASKMSIFQNVK